MSYYESDGTAYAERADSNEIVCVEAYVLAAYPKVFKPLRLDDPKVIQAKNLNQIEYQQGLTPFYKMVKAIYSTCMTGKHFYDAPGRNLNVFQSAESACIARSKPDTSDGVYICKTDYPCPFCVQLEAQLQEDIDKEVTLGELSKHTGLSVEHLCVLIQRGKLPPGRKVGRTRRLYLREAMEKLNENHITIARA